ncbi:hypothetical protein [Sphingobacterium thalpophilum]|uniref:Uncharacterized protein n=1 Tax=Sphingobacterium thalpophilum TaxID=259 RepID=A0A4U9VV16_9SPHI|nr:hypothetical protein [Sphingobacterium thalpophilum]VTR51396.1 Uncharacterised protein [Sphingobacterium thalpophilum]
MAQRKSYNPNTKYGRRKSREDDYRRVAIMTDDERSKLGANTFGCMLLFIITGGLIVFFLFGGDGLMRWLGGKHPY